MFLPNTYLVWILALTWTITILLFWIRSFIFLQGPYVEKPTNPIQKKKKKKILNLSPELLSFDVSDKGHSFPPPFHSLCHLSPLNLSRSHPFPSFFHLAFYNFYLVPLLQNCFFILFCYWFPFGIMRLLGTQPINSSIIPFGS